METRNSVGASMLGKEHVSKKHRPFQTILLKGWATWKRSMINVGFAPCHKPAAGDGKQLDTWIFHSKPRQVYDRCDAYIYICMYIYIIEGSLEVKLPTIWTDEKQSRAEAERRERLEERRSEEKESAERRCRCAKRSESRETLCFSNDLWLRRVEK